MTRTTVTSQAELDAALADEAVTEIVITGPVDVLSDSRTKQIEVSSSGRVERVFDSGRVGSVSGSGRVGSVSGSGRVERVFDSGRVEWVFDSGRVGSVSGSGSVGSVYDSGSVGSVSGSGRVGSVSGSGRVEWVYDSGRVGSVYDSGSVGSVSGSGRVGSVYGSGRVGSVYDSGSVGSVSDSGSVGSASGTASVHMYGGTLTHAGPRVAVFRRDPDAQITGGVVIDCTIPDVELMGQVLDQIDAHPALWDQSSWVSETDCGTAYCFAGWAAVLRAGPDAVTDGNARSIAVSELCLSEDDADRLFVANNSRADLARITNDIAAQAGLTIPRAS